MSSGGAGRSVSARVRGLSGVAAAAALTALAAAAPAANATPVTPNSAPGSYTAATPQLATITNGTNAAPWNLWQGDQGFTLSWGSGNPTGSSAGSVLPVYVPGGPTVNGTDPNVSVVPGALSGTDGDGDFPYSSGVAGTPGPLPGYCGTGDWTAETAATSTSRQPNGLTLPMAPEYFPHVVANSDGTLTGYFDYRPKDADEAVLAATSTDGGKSWTYDGEALEQNQGFCPSANTNDDGQGHPNVVSISSGRTTSSTLYTLQRPAGDNVGVGLLANNLTTAGATESNPLGDLPSSQPVGVDPDSFATAAATITTGGNTTVGVQSIGTANSPEQLMTGGFVDLTADPTPDAADVFICTVNPSDASPELDDCSANGASSTINVATGDLIEQVLGYIGGKSSYTGSGIAAIDASTAQTTTGDGGTADLYVWPSPNSPTAIGFTDPLSGETLNTNAPNRIYVNGTAVYCSQSNNNPTTKLEDCTTAPGVSAFTPTLGAPVTADPIIPAGTQVTNGLVSPDGIVGTLPKYPGAPSGSTIVMYTEKELDYYVAGEAPSAANFGVSGSDASFPIPFQAYAYMSDDLSQYLTQGANGYGLSQPVTFNMGDDATTGPNVDTFVPVTCTGLTDSAGDGGGNGYASVTAGADDELTGCTVPTQFEGDPYDKNSMIAAPDAALISPQTLGLSGEGSSSNAAKLFDNNEDYEVLRVAYTTDGVNFSDAGLANNGIISGNNTAATGYNDITNPITKVDPPNGLNQYTPGQVDSTEMRWPGAAGTIIDYPNGTIGMFMSGAWAGDGDSDAFNQIYYTSSTDGQHWTEPVDVVSTDYTFSALNDLQSEPSAGLGISGYYSGRAYDPTVFQNTNGSLEMLFAGYSTPKPLVTTGSVLGTGATQWTVGPDAPAAYRNILVTNLTAQPQALQLSAPGTGTVGSTGTISVTGGGSSADVTLSVDPSSTGGCTLTGVNDGSATTTATVNYNAAGTCVIDANQAGDSVYAAAAQVQQTIALSPGAQQGGGGSNQQQGNGGSNQQQGGSGGNQQQGGGGAVTTTTSTTTTPTTTTPATTTPATTTPTATTTRSTKSSSKTKVTTAHKTLTVGQKPKLTVTVTSSKKATGTVKVYDGKKLLKTVKYDGRKLTVMLSAPKVGTHHLTIDYLGSSKVRASHATLTIKVEKQSTRSKKK